MATYINRNSLSRAARVEIFKALIVILTILMILMVLGTLIFKSFDKCGGAFGDSVHLDLRKHKNYKQFVRGKCNDNNNGTESQEFSFIARLIYSDGNIEAIGCAGTLISDKLVLTAAHCLDVPMPYELTEIHLGTGENTIKVKKFDKIGYPKYNASKFVHDIALIKFHETVKFSSSIDSLCLPLNDSNIPKNITLTLWDDESNVDDFGMNEINIPGIEFLDCSQKFFNLTAGRAFKPISSIDQFCADEKTRKRGNSGMPVRKSNTIYGLMAYGTSEKYGNMPTVFSKIHSYRHWILCNA